MKGSPHLCPDECVENAVSSSETRQRLSLEPPPSGSTTKWAFLLLLMKKGLFFPVNWYVRVIMGQALRREEGGSRRPVVAVPAGSAAHGQTDGRTRQRTAPDRRGRCRAPRFSLVMSRKGN